MSRRPSWQGRLSKLTALEIPGQLAALCGIEKDRVLGARAGIQVWLSQCSLWMCEQQLGAPDVKAEAEAVRVARSDKLVTHQGGRGL